MNLQLIMAIIASSYITLGVFDADRAADLWAPYAAITFLISIYSLWRERKNDTRRRS